MSHRMKFGLIGTLACTSCAMFQQAAKEREASDKALRERMRQADGYAEREQELVYENARVTTRRISEPIKFCGRPYGTKRKEQGPQPWMVGLSLDPARYWFWFDDRPWLLGIPAADEGAFDEAVRRGASMFGMSGLVCFWLDPQEIKIAGKDDVALVAVTKWEGTSEASPSANVGQSER